MSGNSMGLILISNSQNLVFEMLVYYRLALFPASIV